jgi:hypothetical protein
MQRECPQSTMLYSKALRGVQKVTNVVHIRDFTLPRANEPTRVSPSKCTSRSPNASQNTQTGIECCLQHHELLSHHSAIALVGEVAPCVGYGPGVGVVVAAAAVATRRRWLGSLRCDFGSTDGNGIDAHARSPQQLSVRVKMQVGVSGGGSKGVVGGGGRVWIMDD